MRPRRPLRALLVVLALAATGGAATAAGLDSAPSLQPAPPPSSYCRVAPLLGWPVIGAGPAPDLTTLQDYRAALAIDSPLPGAGIRIADVEYEWAAGHAELAARRLSVAGDSGLDQGYRARDHGTAVLGVLGAADDGRGITGLANRATLLPISPIVAGGYQPVAAIGAAAAGLRAGDVLLIELQALVERPGRPTVLGPIEYYPTVRDEIAKAVARGIVVVEPAGNGALDVGTLGQSWLSDPSSGSASGALMVGAGGSGPAEPDVPDLQRVPGSNYGARVDVQGAGAAVVTSGYGDLSPGADADQAYTACFDGTSSASATVAAAAAVLQGEALARTGAPLSPPALRALLVQTGLPQVTPGDEGTPPQNIGPRPQVASAVLTLSAPQSPPPADSGGTATTGTSTPTAAVPVSAPLVSGVSGSTGTTHPVVRTTAVRGLATRFDRTARRLVINLRGAPSSATARAGSRRVRVRGGRLVFRHVAPGRFLLRISAASAAGVSYRTVYFRITIPVRGAVRITRL